jgi:hypothetical protein
VWPSTEGEPTGWVPYIGNIILDSSSVFSCGSFDIFCDSGRWLIIAGQE